MIPHKVPGRTLLSMCPDARRWPLQVLTNVGGCTDLLLISTILAITGPIVLATSGVGDLLGDLLLGAVVTMLVLTAYELLCHRPKRLRRATPLAGAFVLATITVAVVSSATVLYGLAGGPL